MEIKNVYVAMSGGVDSSVAAALCKKQGHHVVGVFFKPWQPEGFICNWKVDRLDAMRVAVKLGIEFKTWDFSKEYGEEVASYMIEGYRAGITPNPDIMCNKEIKFGLFLKKALAEGADYIATGHYARISHNVKGDASPFTLLKGIDENKDQSYFLWTLTQDQLKHCLFPIGDYTKPQVRAMARKFGLPTHDKKDSQGVCFVGELNMKDFLEKYIKPFDGDIVLKETGEKIGIHSGSGYYTIGQRHGLDIKNGGGPYYVCGKNMKANIVYVTNDKIKMMNDAMPAGRQECKITDLNWIGEEPQLPLNAQVKIRYRTTSIPATIYKDKIVFKKQAEAITPGQSAVFYKGDEVLGGGVLL